MATPTKRAVRPLANMGWDPRLHLFHGDGEDNIDTAVIETQRYAIFVDTMASPELAGAIISHTQPIWQKRAPLVILTHADYDHAWGNAAFALPGGRLPAPIIGHHLCRERLLGSEEMAVLRAKQAEEPELASATLVPPTITCDDRLGIDGGDLTLELLHTPGHTADHLAVWIPEIRLLLAGDAAEHPFPYIGAHSHLATFRRSLRRLADLRPAMVIPCHGGTTEPALLDRNLTYFATLEQRARAIIAAGNLPEDWATRSDLDSVLSYPYAEAIADQGAAQRYEESKFYQDCHRNALRATMAEVLAGVS